MLIQQLDIHEITEKEANLLWDKVKDQPCFDDFSVGRMDLFAERLAAPTTAAFLCDAGLVTVENIVPMLTGFIHCFLFKKVAYSEIAEAGRVVLATAFQNYDLHRISATPPSSNTFAIRAAVEMGMKYEGTIRQTWLQGGEFHDVHLYGILRSEFEGGE